jgi:four helix bundle protein
VAGYRGAMSDSRNLRVLDAAEDLAATVIQAAQRIDTDRVPAVKGQLVRAASAIAANIAEASNLGTDPNFKRQLRLALSSANETGSHLRIIKRTNALDPITTARCQSKLSVVCKMLSNLIRAVEETEARAEEARRARPKR